MAYFVNGGATSSFMMTEARIAFTIIAPKVGNALSARRARPIVTPALGSKARPRYFFQILPRRPKLAKLGAQPDIHTLLHFPQLLDQTLVTPSPEFASVPKQLYQYQSELRRNQQSPFGYLL